MDFTNIWKFVLILGLHLMFLGSVFDIYFRSPVISSARHHAPKFDTAAPAKRLVLFVADGLRAQSVFDFPNRTPFLNKVANDIGAYGISHTKLPTESRPGHVALIAGMFEDPSAITKGWQENPVDFDTVFNQSENVWSWGSPDILPIFAKSAKVRTEMYAPDEEKFFEHQDISQLDTWVFDKVSEFLRNNGDNEVLRRSDKIVLFLHLLGLDTNGHANKPHSKQFEHNLRIVDSGVQDIFRQCESFWRHDGRTSYIFTADHGMTDWGSHGAGMDHETQTPIFAWGAGVRSPQIGKSISQFSSKKSYDVNQTDVAPLMSTLLGLNYPQHSLGKVPLDFLSIHDSDKIEAKIANAMQIHEQYLSFKAKRTDSILPTIISRPDPLTLDLKQTLSKIAHLKSKSNYRPALLLAEELFQQSLKALFHYQRYHRLPLYIATSFTYIGFIIYVILVLIEEFSTLVLKKTETRVINFNLFLTLGFCYSSLATFGQNVPWHFFIYYFSPFCTWTLLMNKMLTLQLAPNIKSYGSLKYPILYLITVEFLVLSFFDRRFVSAALTTICMLQMHDYRKKNMWLWICLCLALSAFTFSPTVGKDRMPFLVLTGAALSSIIVTVHTGTRQGIITYLPMISGLCVVACSEDCFTNFARWTSWLLFVISLPLAFRSPKGLLPRLTALNVSILTMYSLFSLTYEGLFLLCLILTMSMWLVIEYQKNFVYSSLEAIRVISNPQPRNIIDNEDWKRALTFLTFAVTSFFGTGNIASLNSFDPKSIQTLVSTFSPFLMGGLLLLKVIIPFYAVALFAFCVQYVTKMPPKALFLMVLVFSDIMGLHFFFMVTDQGSWLDIGTSLSHFVIAESTVIFLQIMFLLASLSMNLLNQETIDETDSFVIKHK